MQTYLASILQIHDLEGLTVNSFITFVDPYLKQSIIEGVNFDILGLA